jgi:glycolate oxidase iron-sulfur subunit
MASLKELVRLMKSLEDQLVVCMRCGMCQAVCPLFAETGREADVARGKLALLEGLMQEMFENPNGVYERLNRCLLCGSCEANCPSGVNVLGIFIKARAILTGYMGLPLAKKTILRGMLAHPQIFDRITEWASKYQRLFTKPVDEILGTSCARFVSPLLADRHFKPLAPVPLHGIRPSLNTNPGSSGIKVAFFVGCLIDKIFPRTGEAVIEVLQHHGVGLFMPERQACCGIPAISSGDTKTFNQLVLHNLEKFGAQDFEYLVTACATCTSTIKKVWPLMARDHPEEVKAKIVKIAENTLDISQFLMLHIELEKVSFGTDDNKITVSYHDPCHLKKSLGVSAEPRALIRANPRYRFKEMPESDLCCGMGGAFNLQYYEISASIGKRKRDSIVASESSVVATGCPACMIQISDMLSQSKDGITVRHPIEIYEELIKKQWKFH